MSIITKYELWLQRFLDGPGWLYWKQLEKRWKKYRSPTLALLAWIVGLVFRLLTLPGRMLVVSGSIVMVYGLVAFDSPARIMVVLVVAILLFDFVAGWFFCPRLEITRSVPERVRAGSNCRIAYRVINRRRIPLWGIRLDSYSFKFGLKTVESPIIGGMPSGAAVEVFSTLHAVRRGKYLLYRPIAEIAFPLGIFKHGCRGQGREDTLMVYPSYHRLNALELPVGLKYQRDGVSRASKVGDSMDFFGCREFRDGDDARHIYWPGSARTGELVVKEYQAEYLTRIALIIDTYVPLPKSFQFWRDKAYSGELEGALSLAAAVTEFLTKGEYVVDIFAAGADVYHFQAGRHLTGFDAILDIIACLELNHDHPVHRLSQSVLEEVSGIGSAVLVLLGWDKERDELVRRMREAGVALRIIVICRETCELPPEITAVRLDDINAGRITSL